MKKILTTVTCAAILAATASADIARVEIGAGAWAQTPSGEITYTDGGATGRDTANETDETQGYVWMLIKHPVPIVPNIRAEYAGVKSEGTVSGEFKTYTLNSVSKSTLEITQYEVIPYYNILDNTFWMTVDLGIDIKMMDVSYNVDALAVDLPSGYEDTSSIVLPLGYLRARVQVPSTELGVEADVKYVSYDDNTMYDVRVKVDYTFDITPVIQPGIEIGYRMQKIETDETADANINLEFSGVYAGVMLRF